MDGSSTKYNVLDISELNKLEYEAQCGLSRIQKAKNMWIERKYQCIICGYIYDPAENDNVEFKDLPEDWVCPECGVGKDQFEEM